MALDSRTLRYFVEVVRLGNISRAAEQTAVSQPAISKCIKQLEDHFKVELLIRSSVGVTPTDAGWLLYRRAESIGAEIARAESEVLDLAAMNVGAVCVGALPSQMWELMPNVCKKILKTPNGIKLRIIEQSRSNLQEGLIRGEFDLVVSAIRSGETPCNVSFEPLFVENHSLVVRKNHPAARTLHHASKYPWIVPPVTSKRRAEIDQVLNALGIGEERSLMQFIECHSNRFLKSIVRESDCVGLTPYAPSQNELQMEGLALLTFDSQCPPRTVSILTRNDHPLTNAARSVAHIICTVASEMVVAGFKDEAVS
jgi:DNA-binding transcriptional LysR family regulator